MPKLSLLFIFIFISALEALAVVKGEISREDMIKCTNALLKIDITFLNEKYNEPDHFDDNDMGNFRYFWHKSPSNVPILKAFADKIDIMKKKYRLNIYEKGLINTIFLFMSKMRNVIEHDKINIDILPDYIEKVIYSIDKLSPTEMFIYTRIIEGTAEQLKHTYKVNFEYPESEFETLFDNLFYVLRSKEQEKYSLAWRSSHSAEIPQNNLQIHLSRNERQVENRKHSDSYIAGVEHLDKNLKIAESLVLRNIDPYNDHIPEFADLIDTHIDFIRRGIKSQDFLDRPARLRLLELFRKKGHLKKNDEEVTYQWWLNFHLHLSILATPTEHLNENHLLGFNNIVKLLINDIDIMYLEALYQYPYFRRDNKHYNLNTLFNSMEDLILSINRFPRTVMLPTIDDLGIISINKAHREGVHIIRLNNGPIIGIEGRLIYPDDLFISDIYYHSSNKTIDSKSKFFRNYFQQKLDTLTEREREAVEYIDFISNYEDGSFSELIVRNHHIESIHLLFFIPDHLSNNGVKRFINKGKKAFVRLISDMNEELGLVRRPLLDLSEKQITSLHCLIADIFLKGN